MVSTPVGPTARYALARFCRIIAANDAGPRDSAFGTSVSWPRAPISPRVHGVQRDVRVIQSTAPLPPCPR